MKWFLLGLAGAVLVGMRRSSCGCSGSKTQAQPILDASFDAGLPCGSIDAAQLSGGGYGGVSGVVVVPE